MSDFEEPAAKMSKIESGPKEQEDELDEGHEEWLSEGILTDDDYNPAVDQESNPNTSQDDTSIPDTAETVQENADSTQDVTQLETIEETLDNFENVNQTEFPDELGAFLIRKTDGTVMEPKKVEVEVDGSTRHSDDDGHDTDELLRMLGEENGNKKDMKKDGKDAQESSDDDEYIFEGAKIAKLKVARNAIMKKFPSKAVPEDLSDGEGDTDKTSDDGQTVKRMFGVSRRLNVAAKSTARSAIRKFNALDKSKVTSTPLPKPAPMTKITPTRAEQEELIDEEEFLDEDQLDLDEELGSSAEGASAGVEAERGGLRLMRPERMDEDAPSDPDSVSDDDSVYDELPSSDSDDLNEWFTLDVRAERAGDYIPLLGAKAHQLLLAEKQRVSARLGSLRQTTAALDESSAQQAELLRRATLQLAELDSALRA